MSSVAQSRYLLILACSDRKRPEHQMMPAIQRYQGVNYTVLFKVKRQGRWPQSLDLLILSAKYGLIQPDTLIANYDEKMTRGRALDLREQTSQDLASRLASGNYHQIFVNCGQTYLLAFAEAMSPWSERVVYAEGGIGQRMSQMKQWLQLIEEIARP